MCGRATFTNPYAIHLAVALLLAEEDAAFAALAPRYNAAPSQQLPIVLEHKGNRYARLARWGLVPHWATNPKIANKLINARSETAHDKPSFRDALRTNRCLVVLDGFYEWQRIEGQTAKQPYLIRMRDARPFLVAGLWSRWRDKANPDASPVLTCTVLTTAANELMAPLHDRMPVIVDPADAARWLGGETAQDEARALLRPAPHAQMEAYPVSQLVNAPANDLPACLDAQSVA